MIIKNSILDFTLTIQFSLLMIQTFSRWVVLTPMSLSTLTAPRFLTQISNIRGLYISSSFFKKKKHSHFLYGFFKPSCSYEFIQLYEFSCFSIFFLDFAQVSFTGTSHDVFFQSLPMRGVNHVKFCTSLKKVTKKSKSHVQK